jgi:hypothetical protein
VVIKLSKVDLTNDHSPKIPGFFDVRRGVNPTFENFAATLSPYINQIQILLFLISTPVGKAAILRIPY